MAIMPIPMRAIMALAVAGMRSVCTWLPAACWTRPTAGAEHAEDPGDREDDRGPGRLAGAHKKKTAACVDVSEF
jgi:hypothetical protein